ncbi:MAG TPA: D-alanyl-D-alanine carboxypeptidase, partial [Firmicutes bacterium]|nr:D-alanyl-D-alanine carboxypeptidase [Bacillota bacterium]
MLKRSLYLILFLIFLITFYAFAPAVSARVEPPSEFESEGILLMDAGTGKNLVARNEHEKYYPASLTKIMTILLVLEGLEEGRYSLDDMVTISENTAGQVGSRIFLSQGDVVSLEELMIGIAVGSANDATMAVAEYCFGSAETFVNEMNKKAAALGMKNTNFVTPHGLHNDNHYSTPYDVALMSRELLNYPKVHEWFSIWLDENFLAGKIKSERVYLSNTNQLIYSYSGADGIKTGYTSEA